MTESMDRRNFLKMTGAAALAPREALAQSDPNTFDITPFTNAERGTIKERLILQRELVEHIRTLEAAGKVRRNLEGGRKGMYEFDFKETGLLGVDIATDSKDHFSIRIFFFLPESMRQHRPENEGWIALVSSISEEGGKVRARANIATDHIKIHSDLRKGEVAEDLWTREFYGAIQMILARG